LRLDNTSKRTRSQLGIITLLGEPFTGFSSYLNSNVLVRSKLRHLANELVDNLQHVLTSQCVELNNSIQSVAELGRKRALDIFVDFTGTVGCTKANSVTGFVSSTSVRRHDQDHVVELDGLTGAV